MINTPNRPEHSRSTQSLKGEPFLSSLDVAIESITEEWCPVSTTLIKACRSHLEQLLKTPASEPWLEELHRDAPANKELHRDPQNGFVLLAHTEPTGLYRPPHDHGRGWVIYALQQGEMEMGTYARLVSDDGSVQLVQRGSTTVHPGEIQVYLPGDIHDTRCISGPALLFRFTERDLKKEDKDEHRVTRYVDRDGTWTSKRS